MNELSPLQLATLWGELVDAYWGKNSFGGDEAEIYAYTLQPANPQMYLESTRPKAEIVLGRQASRALCETLEIFCVHYECRVLVDGVPFRKALKHPLIHRCHVKIVRKK